LNGDKAFKQGQLDNIQKEHELFLAMAPGMVSELIASKTKKPGICYRKDQAGQVSTQEKCQCRYVVYLLAGCGTFGKAIAFLNRFTETFVIKGLSQDGPFFMDNIIYIDIVEFIILDINFLKNPTT